MTVTVDEEITQAREYLRVYRHQREIEDSDFNREY